MAKVRVKDMASISSNAQDDHLMTDGTTNGTKSIAVNDFLKQVSVSDVGGLNYSTTQGHEGLEVKLNGGSLTKGASGLSVTNPVPDTTGVTDGQVLMKTTTSGSPSMTWGDVPRSPAIAPDYNASSTYSVGDAVMYNGYRYVCNTAIAVAEAWTAAHWTQTSVEETIGNVETLLAAL